VRARIAKFAGVKHAPTLEDLARHTGSIFLHGLELRPAAPSKKSTKKKPRSTK